DGGADLNCLATKVGESGLSSGDVNGIAIDSRGNLYVFRARDHSYVQIDPNTGLSLGQTAFANPSGEGYALAAAAFNENDGLFASRLNYGDDPADLIIINF